VPELRTFLGEVIGEMSDLRITQIFCYTRDRNMYRLGYGPLWDAEVRARAWGSGTFTINTVYYTNNVTFDGQPEQPSFIWGEPYPPPAPRPPLYRRSRTAEDQGEFRSQPALTRDWWSLCLEIDPNWDVLVQEIERRGLTV
jgi:hypothetical protein